MSSRKPKSVILRHDLDDSGDEALLKTALGAGLQQSGVTKGTEEEEEKKKKKKKLRRKIKVASQLEIEEESIDSTEFQVKQRPKKKAVSLPIFNNLEEEEVIGPVDQTLQIRRQLWEQKVPRTESNAQADGGTIRAVVSDEDQVMLEAEGDHKAPQEPEDGSHVYFKEEAISLVSPEHDSDRGVDVGSDIDVLDDGRLPLSERELAMHKKMHEMEIKEAMYDIEISGDDELDDWEASKMRNGGLVESKSTVIQSKFPKMNLLHDTTFKEQMERMDAAIAVLRKQQEERSSEIERLEMQRVKYDEELSQLVAKVSTLSYS